MTSETHRARMTDQLIPVAQRTRRSVYAPATTLNPPIGQANAKVVRRRSWVTTIRMTFNQYGDLFPDDRSLDRYGDVSPATRAEAATLLYAYLEER